MDEEKTLVVQASYTESPLNEGSLLFFKEKVVIGKVCEIFGPITTPFYVVKWAVSSSAAINSNRVPCNKDGNKKMKSKKKNRKRSDKTLEEKDIMEEEVESGAVAIVADGETEAIAADGETEAIVEEGAIREQAEGLSEVTEEDKTIVNGCITKVPIEEVSGVTDAVVVDMCLGDTLTADPLISTVEANISHISSNAGDATNNNTSQSQIRSEPCADPVVASAAQIEHFISLMSRALPGTSGAVMMMKCCALSCIIMNLQFIFNITVPLLH